MLPTFPHNRFYFCEKSDSSAFESLLLNLAMASIFADAPSNLKIRYQKKRQGYYFELIAKEIRGGVLKLGRGCYF